MNVEHKDAITTGQRPDYLRLGVSLGVSEDRFYFCTDGLLWSWVRNAPLSRTGAAGWLALSDIL